MSDTDVKAIQRRRGTAAEFDGFTTGLEGEITVNTTNNSVVVSDGNMNNYEASRADMTNVDQFDIMKRGIADNSLTNTVFEYKLDMTGSVQQVRKSADQIKAQLTKAYIADKDLTNVPLQIMLNKGIAKYTFANVPFSAVSWDSDAFREHIGSEEVDITGGGLAFRNLQNLKAETFNSIPTDDFELTGGGVAYKTLENVDALKMEVKTQIGVASIDMANVSDDTLYGKGGSRKYLLQRDLNNIDGPNVDPENLTYAGIAQKNLSNIDFNGDAVLQQSVLDTLGSCNYNLDHVSLTVFTDKFHLMKDDGSNAVKEKVFKGIKNLLLNGDFKEKHSAFADVSMAENEIASKGDTFYSEWVAMYDGAKIHLEDGLATISGSWGQCIGWDAAFSKIDALYFSCSKDSSTDINVSLMQPSKDGWITISANVINDIEGKDYDRKGCKLIINKEKLLKKVPLMLVISGGQSKIGYCQLEREGITNFYQTPSNYSRMFSGEASGKTCYLQIHDKLPAATDEYYKLEPLFTSDGAAGTKEIYYYSLKSNGYVHLSDTKKCVRYGDEVYRFVGDSFELYCLAATGQFKLVDSEEVVTISKFKNGDLFFSEEDGKIHTFANDDFYYMYDTIPYQGLLYIDGKYSDHSVFLWNALKEDFEVVTSEGTGLASLPLFTHLFSDRRLESAGWTEADSFSKKSASVYQGAYDYLVNQLHPVGKLIAGGSVGDQVGASEQTTWIIEWSDNQFENTIVSLLLNPIEAKQKIIEFCNKQGYLIDGAIYDPNADPGTTIITDVPGKELHDLVFRKVLKQSDDHGIVHYKTYDGLRIVIETQEACRLITTQFESTGNGWFYLLNESDDIKQAYFRLPRMKGFAVTEGVVEEPYGESYQENITFNTDVSKGFAAVKHKLYFYMGVPSLKREEVAVNSVFSALSQIDTKLNKSIYDLNGVEESTVDSKTYHWIKLGANTHEFVWKPKKNNSVILIDLTSILGEKDQDPITKIYPASVYNEFTKFAFKLCVDKSFIEGLSDKTKARYYIKYYIKNDARAKGRPQIITGIGYDEYFSNSGTDTLTNVPVEYNDATLITNYDVFSNIRAGFDAEIQNYTRDMFVFDTTLITRPQIPLNVMHLDGDEVVNGVKIFTGTPVVANTTPAVLYNNRSYEGGVVNPASNTQTAFSIVSGTNGLHQSYLEQWYYTDGSVNMNLCASTYKTDGSRVVGALTARADRNGGVYTYAATPGVEANDTRIATTNYVNNKFQVVSVLPANPNANVFYFIPE